MALHRAKNVLTSVILLAAVTSACHATQRPASPATSTTKPPTTTQSVPPPVVNIAPLAVRPVEKSQPTTPDKCAALHSNAPAAPSNGLITCDLAQTTRYTLRPEAMRLGLTQVDAPKSLTAGFYEVLLTLDPPSATGWSSFTAAHLHDHVAFIRDELVLEAPMIEEQVTSGQIALTTQTIEAADQLAELAGRPA